MTITARTLITRSLSELMFFAEGDTPSAAAMADGLVGLNGLIASWHNEGMLVMYPPSTLWRGQWTTSMIVAVNDSVARSGATYTCFKAHSSTLDDKPGASPNWATYWTLYAETPLTLDSNLPFGPEHERGIMALLALEISPYFNIDPTPSTQNKASMGKTALLAQFLPIQPVRPDTGLVRLPSSVWPVSVDMTSV